MVITGTIEKIMDTKKISDSFEKRELVVKTAGQYPQEILIEFHQDKTESLEGYQIGQAVDVSINIRGKSWKSPQDGKVRWFNTIQGWKIEITTIQENSAADMGDDVPY